MWVSRVVPDLYKNGRDTHCVAILRRDSAKYRAWMMRGYAIGQGAGTQALTGLIWVLIFGTPTQHSHKWLMGASWVINLLVAEWIIRRKRSKLANSVITVQQAARRQLDGKLWGG